MSEQPISRRSAIRICGAGAIALTIPRSPAWMFAEPDLVECQTALDHIMVGASDLDAGVAWFEQLTGVRPVFAGNPVGRANNGAARAGVRNATVSIGPRQYLEVIAPDPAEPNGAARILPLLQSSQTPRPFAWGAKLENVDDLRRNMQVGGLSYDPPTTGSRTRPNGRVVEWVNLYPVNFPNHLPSVLPFFIQWSSNSVHPSADSPGGCTLASLRFESPIAESAADLFRRLGLRADVRSGPQSRILVTLTTPRGHVEL